MSLCAEIGRRNRIKIIKYLTSAGTWVTVKTITQATGISGRSIVYAHCNNLVRERILEKTTTKIRGRNVIVYRYAPLKVATMARISANSAPRSINARNRLAR